MTTCIHVLIGTLFTRLNLNHSVTGVCPVPFKCPHSSACATLLTAAAPFQLLCNIHGGRYVYMDDLLALETQPSAAPLIICPLLQHITTPLRVEAWESHLAGHSDPDFAQYLLRGTQQGFSIGIQGNASCWRAKQNLHSAYVTPRL